MPPPARTGPISATALYSPHIFPSGGLCPARPALGRTAQAVGPELVSPARAHQGILVPEFLDRRCPVRCHRDALLHLALRGRDPGHLSDAGGRPAPALAAATQGRTARFWLLGLATAALWACSSVATDYAQGCERRQAPVCPKALWGTRGPYWGRRFLRLPTTCRAPSQSSQVDWVGLLEPCPRQHAD